MENELARAVLTADIKAQYDAQCKLVLSQKEVLAWILQGVAEEFAQMSVEEIKSCIEGTPEISSEKIYSGQAGERIVGIGNESRITGEGSIYYDIRFLANIPQGRERIRLMINVEAQKDYYPGYQLPTRGIFYCARMISSQLGTEFSGSDYDGLKKVYSIWICSEVPENRKNSIFRYRISEDVFAGKTREREQKQHYDMMTALILCLGKPQDKKENMALDLLSSLLSEELSAEEKLRILNEEFQIPITQQLDEEVSLMCNLSQGIENRGIQKGIEKGIEKGIRGAIDICRKLNLPEEEILRQIMQQYELSEDTAREYLQKEE